MVNVNVGRNNVLNRVTNQQDKWKRQVCHDKLEGFYVAERFVADSISGARTENKNLQPALNAELEKVDRDTL